MSYDKKLTEADFLAEVRKIEQRKRERAVKLLGIKNDQEKPPLSLLPVQAVEAVGRGLAFGAKKYGKHNWRGGMDHTRLSSAALRHIFAYIDGENLDTETNEEHIAHAICGLLFLLESRIKGYGRDDRHCAGTTSLDENRSSGAV